jgi:hypothetical protein
MSSPGTLRFGQVATKPSPPPAGYDLIYIKTDNVLYIQDSSGTEIPLGSASAITALTGEATASGPGSAVITLSNSAVIGKVLTGFVPGPNSPVLATDTLLEAVEKLQAQIAASSGSAITALTGDVSATGPGSAAAVVNAVGGKTATDIASAVTLVDAATSTNTASTLVERDASGNFAANIISASLTGNVTGNVSGSSASFTGPLVGDVSRTQGATSVDKIKGTPVNPTPPLDAEVLIYNSTVAAWVPETLSGDVEIDHSGVTVVQPNVIDNSKLATMAAHTIKGNSTGSTGTPTDLTSTQVTAELNNFVGDTGSGGTKGLVPAPASGDAAANKYLKADGTWEIVPMGTGTVTSVSVVTANGISGTVATPTTTPAITLTLGAITPSDVNISSLTPSQAVVTDSSNNLVSLAYAFSAVPGSLAQRDSSGNMIANNMFGKTYQVVSAGTTTIMSVSSPQNYRVTGTTTQTLQLPNATTVINGWRYYMNNNSTGIVTVNDASGATLFTMQPGSFVRVIATDTSTTAGAWDYQWSMPSSAVFGDAGLAVTGTISASSTISASNLSGTNTGDQTITLTGDVTGSGTGSFATNVGRINGVSLAGLATGILKNTTTTGVPSIAVASDFPTLNQNTTGTAANITATTNSSLVTLSSLSLPAVQVTGLATVATTGNYADLLSKPTLFVSPLTTKGDVHTYSTTDARLPVGSNGQVLAADSTQTTGLKWVAAGGTGTVTSASVVTANGFSGTVATATTTPAITLSTTVSGILIGSSGALAAAVSGTDYSAGTAALATGLVLSTTGTGALTIATDANIPGLALDLTGSTNVRRASGLSTFGQIGVGTNSPKATLEVTAANAGPATSGSSTNGVGVRLGNNSGNIIMDMGSYNSGGFTWIQSRHQSNYSLNYKLVLNPNGGNLLINTTTDDGSHSLQVNGTILGTGATLSGLTPSSVVFTDGSSNLTSSGIVPVANGGTGVTSVTTTPTANAFSGWDANKNYKANSYIQGLTTTATAAGTTTLTVSSSMLQQFTGTLTQTIVLPDATTLSVGQPFVIANRSTGILTVKNGASTTLTTVLSGTSTTFTNVSNASTAGTWDFSAPPGTLTVAAGGTGKTSVTTVPTASSWAGWDSSKNFSANSYIRGVTSTAGADPTTLTVTSTQLQIFTTSQTVILPSALTMAVGGSFTISNTSAGAVTVNANGGSLIQTVAAGQHSTITLITNGTAVGVWDVSGGTASTGGSVTSVSVVTANGLGGTVANPTTTPAITLTTSVNGIVMANGSAFSAAASGVDYSPGTSTNATGIVKSTTDTGALTTAIASDFPILNQATTASAGSISGTNVITNANLVQSPAHTYKGNNTGSTANVADITSAQLTADLNLFTSSLQGLVPASGGGTTSFLRADGTFAVPAGTSTGTVTSVALTTPGVLYSVTGSPITSSGTLTLGLISQAQNSVLAGPTSGSGNPSFRALVAGDIPTLNQNTTGTAANITATTNSTLVTLSALSLPYSQITGGPSVNAITALTGDGTASGPGSAAFTLATVNSNVGSFTNASVTVNAKGLITAISSGSPGGTVTSVALTTPGVLYSVTGSPITTSGTLALGLISQAQNSVLAGPTSGSGNPSFRSLVAADIPTLNQNTTGTAANVTATSNSTLTTLSALSLPTSQVTGTRPVSGGGTGVTSVTTTPTATSFAGWDANKNLNANSYIRGLFSTATAAGTTTLTVASAQQQQFTGTSTQIVVLPNATTLLVGQSFIIANRSTGIVTVNTNGGGLLYAVPAGSSTTFTATSIATSTGTWDFTAAGGSSTSKQVKTFVFDGQGGVPSVGAISYIIFPSAATIGNWTMFAFDVNGAPVTGSCVLDLWKVNYSSYPPTVTNTITASAKPTISSDNKNQSSTLTGWTTSISANDTLAARINSISTATKIVLFLEVTI